MDPRGRVLGACGAVVAAFFSTTARDAAAAPAEAPSETPPPRVHAGMLVWLAVGVGPARSGADAVRGRAVAPWSPALEAALGGSVAPGWFLGGLLHTRLEDTRVAKFVTGGDAGGRIGGVTLVGFLAQRYFDPRGGWHAGAAAGVVLAGDAGRRFPVGYYSGLGGDAPGSVPSGPGGSAHLGYDVWVNGRSCFGMTARVIAAPSAAVETDGESARGAVLSAALLVGYTGH